MKRPLSAIAMRVWEGSFRLVRTQPHSQLSLSKLWHQQRLANEPQLTRSIFLGQELLLDFAAWIDLTSNNDNMSISSLEHQSAFWFFKTCWWLTGLSRLYDASRPPGRHARYFKTRLKILVDRALRQHYFLLTLDQFTCCVSRHNNRCKQSVPRFRLVCYFPLTQKKV